MNNYREYVAQLEAVGYPWHLDRAFWAWKNDNIAK